MSSIWRICVHALEWNPHWKLFFPGFLSTTSAPKCSSPEWPGGRKTLKDWLSCRWRGSSLNMFFYDFLFYYCSWWWDVIVAPFKASYFRGQVTSDISDLGLLEDPGRTSSTVLSKATQTHICLFLLLIFSKTPMIRFTFQRADTIYLFICIFFKILPLPAVILHSGDAKETPLWSWRS